MEKEAREESFEILTTGRTNGNDNSFNTWVAKLENGYGDKETKSAKERTIEFGLEHPVIATKIGLNIPVLTNISSNSQRFADNLGLKEEDEGSGQKNAFRHVLWQATITKRYGIEIAKEVGFAHEENPNALGGRRSPQYFNVKEFSDSLEADELCDLLNNVQGRKIGGTTNGKEMNEIALDVIEKYYTDGFWISKPTSNNKYKISREKLTDLQYKAMKERLKLLNKNGYRK